MGNEVFFGDMVDALQQSGRPLCQMGWAIWHPQCLRCDAAALVPQRFQLNPTLRVRRLTRLDGAGAGWHAVRFLPPRCVP
ncbi:hypothetical protein XCCB100_2113 [Xanthomonas campestris pv. campestris]|uniref:Uncharacterized protein n=1 Tax=Xanthomonas campestris pv. campestris (strain B100) TaxID=509169 RepID=B0RSN1_XANCB|nr:hypothetical protein XCCB100_2113 [Xanthomonas campestris pv. campestris]